MMPAGREETLARLSVSRETIVRLDIFAAALARWNPAINLVAKSTLPALWTRHIADSAQLCTLIRTDDAHWADFGSGGGLPGLIVAAIFAERRPDLRISLVESDKRKATFLRQTAAEMGLNVAVHAERAENIDPLGADVVSARALAPLDRLLALTYPHLAPKGQALFLKGAQYRREIAESLANWRFESEILPSETNPDAVILRLSDIAHV